MHNISEPPLDANHSLPIVLHTYSTKCNTVEQPPGFGDFLRGSLALAEMSREIGFRVLLNFASHPMGKFIVPTIDSPPANLKNEEFFNERMNLLKDHLISDLPNGLVSVTTHAYPSSPIPDFARKTIKEQLVFRKPLLDAANHALSRSRLNQYAVIHIRVRDDDFNATLFSMEIFNEICEHIKRSIVPTWGNSILVISNHGKLRDAVAKQFGLQRLNSSSIHLGECNLDKQDTPLKDTLIDFILLSKSHSIYSLSYYPWPSGFSRQCAEIYQVPFYNIRNELSIPTESFNTVQQPKTSLFRRTYAVTHKLLAFMTSKSKTRYNDRN
jgi:hypothetical protein